MIYPLKRSTEEVRESQLRGKIQTSLGEKCYSVCNTLQATDDSRNKIIEFFDRSEQAAKTMALFRGTFEN